MSAATAINDRGQVVGMSCGADGCRAFLWENGVMKDLNALVAPGYQGRPVFANDIDDAGQLTGQATDPRTGDAVTFLATLLGGNP
ncbi:MAG TPA: hypothetical protein VFA46_21875 [Actinomycetes bacterium]|nr:hypothetical protein [Actinomycetes bacterium]